MLIKYKVILLSSCYCMIYRIILRLIVYVYIDDGCSFYLRGQKYNLAPQNYV